MENEKTTEEQLLTELEAVQSKYKLTEVAFRECEEKYRMVIECTTDSIVVMDWNGRYLLMNSVSAQMLGGKIEDFIGQSLYDSLPKKTADKHLKSIREVIQSGKGHIAENAMQIKDKVQWFHENTQPIKDSSGKVFAVAVISRDITKRKLAELASRQAEEKLRESEFQYRTLLESAPVGIGLATFDGQILSCNVTMSQMTGYSKEELRKIKLKDIYKNPEDRALLLERIKKEGSVRNFEVELKRKDGSLYWASLMITPSQVSGQNIFLTVAEDITERKRAMEALQKSEERFRNLTETTSDWIWEVDEQGIYTYASPKVKELLGYEPKEVIGKTPFDLMPSEEAKRVAAEFGTIVGSRKPFSVLENTNLHKDGRPIMLETSGVPIFDIDGNFRGYRGIDRDITQPKRAEQALVESESKLREQKFALEQKNIALREMIEQIEREKRRVQEDIESNVNTVISPILEKLKLEKTPLKYVDLLQYHLERLTSSYSSKIIKSPELTPREIEICSMVKGGLSNKNIAGFLNISSGTVEKHRKNIRNKLEISHKSINLVSFLREL